VKVPGGGVYMGDMHAMQGDGEIAGHTTDVSGTVTLQVHLLKGLGIDGPIIFPVEEDLPFLAKPISDEERTLAERVAGSWGMKGVEDSVPISIVGSGPDLNAATENGLERAAELLGVTVPEIRNRATITGSIEIGRHPGVVQVTFLAPSEKIGELGLLEFANDQY
ncbi:MAG: acetamidase/formamidase family protein, partial [Candidatus Thermoplasmatota archaeon]|nr:acetamidase/formamidase family protein [Candidatus Thermoplasmatota archaeon]